MSITSRRQVYFFAVLKKIGKKEEQELLLKRQAKIDELARAAQLAKEHSQELKQFVSKAAPLTNERIKQEVTKSKPVNIEERLKK